MLSTFFRSATQATDSTLRGCTAKIAAVALRLRPIATSRSLSSDITVARSCPSIR